jgi:hypothetical protein
VDRHTQPDLCRLVMLGVVLGQRGGQQVRQAAGQYALGHRGGDEDHRSVAAVLDVAVLPQRSGPVKGDAEGVVQTVADGELLGCPVAGGEAGHVDAHDGAVLRRSRGVHLRPVPASSPSTGLLVSPSMPHTASLV